MLPVASTWAQQPNGIIEFNTYPWLSDVQNDNDITINVSIDLPGRFSYFSWSEFTNVLHEGDAGFALAEHNVRWGISDSLPQDLNVQWGLRNGLPHRCFKVVAPLICRVDATKAGVQCQANEAGRGVFRPGL